MCNLIFILILIMLTIWCWYTYDDILMMLIRLMMIYLWCLLYWWCWYTYDDILMMFVVLMLKGLATRKLLNLARACHHLPVPLHNHYTIREPVQQRNSKALLARLVFASLSKWWLYFCMEKYIFVIFNQEMLGVEFYVLTLFWRSCLLLMFFLKFKQISC